VSKIIFLFASSCLCEHEFSALTEIKSKKREKLLGIDDKMRVCLAMAKTCFNLICSENKHTHRIKFFKATLFVINVPQIFFNFPCASQAEKV